MKVLVKEYNSMKSYRNDLIIILIEFLCQLLLIRSVTNLKISLHVL